MDFKISKANLCKILGRAVPATAAKSPMAMLTYVRIGAEVGDTVSALGTDLVMSVCTHSEASVKTPGAVCVPARDLFELARSLPSGDVRVVLRDGRIEISAGKSSKFKLPAIDPEDFPLIPEPDPRASRLVMTSSELGRMLAQTAYARSTDDTRQHIACVRLEHGKDGVTCVATDGHRLALSRGAGESMAESWGADSLNTRAIADIRRLCDERDDETVCVSLTGTVEGYAHFQWSDVRLTCKRINEKFVPYDKLLKWSGTTEVHVPRAEVIDCIKRVALAAQKAGQVRLDFTHGQLAISAKAERGEGHEQVDCDYAGKDVAIGVSPSLMTEALGTLRGDTCLLRVSDATDPVFLFESGEHEQAVALVMPMRL